MKPTAVELPRLDNPKEISQVVDRTVAAKHHEETSPKEEMVCRGWLQERKSMSCIPQSSYLIFTRKAVNNLEVTVNM